MQRPYADVDVFTAEPYRGNPLAVVLDGSGLSTDEMQRFAHWTNLSETTFVLPPTQAGADYRVRIFTPTMELPFAGHPTLGTCHAWLEAGGTPAHPDVVVQECGAGLITIRRDAATGRMAFAAPPLRRSGPLEPEVLAEAVASLRLDPAQVLDSAWIDNGPGWLGLRLATAADVLAIRAGAVTLDIGVVGPHPEGSECAVELRAFFPKDGMTVEDPVTGSLNASVAQWLVGNGTLPRSYVAAQGTALGRAGRVYIHTDEAGQVWVGGHSVTCVRGTVAL
ncbi:MAG TPA: phenazine biosynthesis protein PhzF [Acidimicrobiaceae bacterium]|nr:phenazine biosynthesis protein PhzF [Acidimicrobiaceae bacterium]